MSFLFSLPCSSDTFFMFRLKCHLSKASSDTLATLCKELTHWKRPWWWERLMAGGEGDNRGWDGWMASLTQWTWVWANSRNGAGQGSLVCFSPWSGKVSNTTERMNWTEPHSEDSSLISVLSKELSRVFSNTAVQKHQFFGAQPSLWANSHIHWWLLVRP